jgi:hypothetical protein
MSDATGRGGRRERIGLLACALAALAGCTTEVQYLRLREPLERERIRNVKVVAVLPFRNRSRDSGASGIFESAIRNALTGSFQISERKHLAELNVERGFNQSDLVDPRTRQKLKVMGADAVVVGEVQKYETMEQRGVETVQVPVQDRMVRYNARGQPRVYYQTRMVTQRRPYLQVSAQVAAAIHMVRLSDGQTLVSHADHRSLQDRGGGASNRSIRAVKSGGEMLAQLKDQVVHPFLAKVIRTKVMERRVLDKYWGAGVEAAENGDWDVAGRYFWARHLEDPSDAAGLNNVAVCIEAEATRKRKLELMRKAVEYYQKALAAEYRKLYSKNLRRARAVLAEMERVAASDG